MTTRILKDGKGVGTFHINKTKYSTYNGVIEMASGNNPFPKIFANMDTVDDVKKAFLRHHGGDGYELEDIQ